MAMPSGNSIVLDKMSQWFPDERDSFIWWLRAEFAAANAIIDTLCHHLQVVVGEGEEYDDVVRCIQQRRCNWNNVLHMQQYYPISEVTFALNRVVSMRQSGYCYGKEFRRSGCGFRLTGGNDDPVGKVNGNAGLDENKTELARSENVEKDDGKLSQKECEGEFVEESREENLSNNLEDRAKEDSDNFSKSRETVESHQDENDNQSVSVVSKTFVGSEICDGKMVNVVDGLFLYESFYNDNEVAKLVSLVNDLRTSGKRGQFPDQTYVVSKRPMKGRGREIIQLGVPIGFGPPADENGTGTSRDTHVELIPGLLEDVIERMAKLHIISTRPDSCIIDLFNEGDHSQPHMFPPWFGRPVCVLFLTECDMTFGKMITTDRAGDYRGSLKLRFSSGSLVMMQGMSADTAKHAIPSVHKQRILVTFTKSQQKKCMPSDGQRLTSRSGGQSSHWCPPSNRSPNHVRHHIAHKPYAAAVSTTGILPSLTIHPQIPPNGIPPLLIGNPVALPMPFPTPVPIPPSSTGWAAVLPSHPAPRLLVSGTGVFLPPPGSSISFSQSTTDMAMKSSVDMSSMAERENGFDGSDHNENAVCQGKSDGSSVNQQCNGNTEATSSKHAANE